MNIFAVHQDPVIAAQMLGDEHVRVSPKEAAQMLCTVLRPHNLPYKPTHEHHRCTRWVEQSAENFRWLCIHARALCDEFSFRFGHEHKSRSVIEICEPLNKFPMKGLTPFAQAMPEEFQSDDPVSSYRLYYRLEKSWVTYTRRQAPEWFL